MFGVLALAGAGSAAASLLGNRQPGDSIFGLMLQNVLQTLKQVKAVGNCREVCRAFNRPGSSYLAAVCSLCGIRSYCYLDSRQIHITRAKQIEKQQKFAARGVGRRSDH